MTRNCQPRSISSERHDLLDKIVQSYLDNHAANEERYLRFYAIQRTLPDAITKAALAELPNGKRFSHQCWIPLPALTQARDVLLKLNYSKLTTFTDLHELVAQALRPIWGIGPLTIYDTAHRLGAFFKLSPEHVYLHAGVRVGAKALGLEDWKDKLPMNALPAAFQRLRPEQVEDCLCIYKAELQAWARRFRG
ncbi:MAG: hypothetical protein HZA89_06220 [Verrucomicrobia bacterium]|nr:hypothetical protein [Verrucomicrobiota bacterium]